MPARALVSARRPAAAADLPLHARHVLCSAAPTGKPFDPEGVAEAVAHVRSLIQEEVAAGVPPSRIVVGGFSQVRGCCWHGTEGGRAGGASQGWHGTCNAARGAAGWVQQEPPLTLMPQSLPRRAATSRTRRLSRTRSRWRAAPRCPRGWSRHWGTCVPRLAGGHTTPARLLRPHGPPRTLLPHLAPAATLPPLPQVPATNLDLPLFVGHGSVDNLIPPVIATATLVRAPAGVRLSVTAVCVYACGCG